MTVVPFISLNLKWVISIGLVIYVIGRRNLCHIFAVLGLFEGDPNAISEGIRDRKLLSLAIDRASIEARLAERLEARKNKDFARSDAIRDELQAAGIALMDTPEGTTWKVA